jgi:predicted Zn-dependent peptidase
MLTPCRRSAASALVALVSFALMPDVSRADDAVHLPVTRHVLGNGMKFLIVPFGDAPVVATYMQFQVGGVDDPKGQTGVAHLLEHMMFKGTTTLGTTDYAAEKPVLDALNALWKQLDRARAEGADAATLDALRAQIAAKRAEHERFVVKNELTEIYERCGGTGLNASTGNDSTQYYVQLPSNQLEVWARVESDRIQNPVFREFYSERDVVHEERRLRVDSQPRGRFDEIFEAHAYLVHPYRQPVVGWPEDIDATDHDEVLEYFKTWYAPNNCVVALVGDVDVETTIALVEKWFGAIPARTLPRRRITPEPEQLGERRFRVALEVPSQLTIAWPAPAHGHQDEAALTIASRVLNGGGGFGGGGFGRGGRGGGNPGRLRAKLVDELKVATRVNASVGFGRYPGRFSITASPARDKTMDEVEAAIEAELERLATEPPTQAELDRLRVSIAASAIRGLSSPMGIARAIAGAEAESGDWRALDRDRAALIAVTPEDVARVAKTYFLPTHRVIGIIDGTRADDDDEQAPAPEGSR